MPRVPSDPAQVIVNHASFRVQLGAASARALGLDDTRKLPVVAAALASAGARGAGAVAGAGSRSGAGSGSNSAAGRRRQAPLVWSGRSRPGDPLAGELLRAVRRAGSGGAGGVDGAPGEDLGRGAATQVLPRVDETAVLPPLPTVVGQRPAHEPTRLLSGMRPTGSAYEPEPPGFTGPDAEGGAYDGPGGGPGGGLGDGTYGADAGSHGEEREERSSRNRRGEPVRHAWYPGRRMNLGIVLLPLRVFLGFVCIYAGMGKLCDRVYFDGGRRGSMVTWLTSLHPWPLAEPLREAALHHPVGAGLSIAFLQIVVGVLTVLGLWQRVAAVFGASLSIALLVTVSWRTVPVYDAPHFIYLAAWSPLVIAGAPVYSIDGHLAGDAWRRLGPRVSLWDLRRRVLRRGSVLAAVIIGLTLVVGSLLGAAVRASTPVRHDGGDPTVVPTNNLPGVPLPSASGGIEPGGSPRPTGEATSPVKHRKPAGRTPSATPATGTGGSPSSTGSSGPTRPAGSPPSYGTSSGTSGGTSAGGGTNSGSGGGTHHPQTPSAPPAQQPSQPEPSAKPTQGAIGGLLGSHSPTGLLLGMSPRRQGNPAGMA
ncbi:DoxX family protein [Streptomyces sp. HPF1205]|uniref:DoxX family protein n=1 Tax=Streptomyces sp. HPF1205 TaxID=2873262 RepID=UPI0035ABE1D7